MEGETKRHWRGWWALAAVVAGSVALVLTLYVGMYFALVEPKRFGWRGSGLLGVVPVYPECKWLDLNPFFDPIHQIDRKHLRPGTWGVNPPAPPEV